jgi:5-methylcytosine rRNA methyltransferase NSUN4
MGLSNTKFQDFFSTLYKDRWPAIFNALNVPVKHVLRKNIFADSALINQTLLQCEFLSNCFWTNIDTESKTHAKKNENGINYYYKMDPASVFVANALNVIENESVLDMCAAPGGKSLILAEGLNSTGELISNELSKDRRDRLIRVFQDYIPKNMRQNIVVKGLDGNKYGLVKPDYFDKVLCDVPCSGERHLLENKAEFDLWTEKRSQNLAVRQYSLLSSAWLTCKPGGRIVYSTCSISNYENDQIIKKIIKRRGVEIIRDQTLSKYNFIEPTEYGYQILPDKFGFGPMYFAVMLKV